jgi:cytochrome P450
MFFPTTCELMEPCVDRAVSREESGSFPPEEFVPERFIPAAGRVIPADPRDYVFGFHKRSVPRGTIRDIRSRSSSSVCPGRALAWNNTVLMVASLLATFDFAPLNDKDGVDVQYTPGFSK